MTVDKCRNVVDFCCFLRFSRKPVTVISVEIQRAISFHLHWKVIEQLAISAASLDVNEILKVTIRQIKVVILICCAVCVSKS